MGNEVLNIFLSNNFFEKSNILQENGEKFFRDKSIFQEKQLSYAKIEYNLFHQKLDGKYFHVE